MIRLACPEIPEEDLRAVREVLASGWLVQGRHVAAFERAVAERLGVENAVAVTSGTAALHTALLALGVKPGTAVAVSAYSHVASANAIESCGAEPVFVDVEPRTFNMDPHQLERVLEKRSQARTTPIVAVVVVHAFGQMADLDALGGIARRHGAVVLEDAACALGAARGGEQPAASSAAACFSFHPRKAITTGEGGMIASRDRRVADAARALRNHGQDANRATPDFVVAGLNYRMTEFQAVLGSAALRRLDDSIARRRALATHYDALLAGSVDVPVVAPGSEPAYQSYVVLLPAPLARVRGEIIGALAEAGVEATIGTWSIPTTTYYRERYGYTSASYPVTSDVFARALALPMHDKLTEDDLTQVASALRAAVERHLEAAS